MLFCHLFKYEKIINCRIFICFYLLCALYQNKQFNRIRRDITEKSKQKNRGKQKRKITCLKFKILISFTMLKFSNFISIHLDKVAIFLSICICGIPHVILINMTFINRLYKRGSIRITSQNNANYISYFE